MSLVAFECAVWKPVRYYYAKALLRFNPLSPFYLDLSIYPIHMICPVLLWSPGSETLRGPLGVLPLVYKHSHTHTRKVRPAQSRSSPARDLSSAAGLGHKRLGDLSHLKLATSALAFCVSAPAPALAAAASRAARAPHAPHADTRYSASSARRRCTAQVVASERVVQRVIRRVSSR